MTLLLPLVLVLGACCSTNESELYTVSENREVSLGIREFFDGDYTKSIETLSRVIESGSRDPRAFYFRGAAFGVVGRLNDAEKDLELGAELEFTVNSSVDIPQSLERIQGALRRKVEGARHRARELQRTQLRMQQQSRFEEALSDVTPPPTDFN